MPLRFAQGDKRFDLGVLTRPSTLDPRPSTFLPMRARATPLLLAVLLAACQDDRPPDGIEVTFPISALGAEGRGAASASSRGSWRRTPGSGWSSG